MWVDSERQCDSNRIIKSVSDFYIFLQGVENKTCDKQDYLLYIAMHTCSAMMDTGPGPSTKAQKLLGRRLGAHSFWALGLGSGPISILAEHMCVRGNQ